MLYETTTFSAVIMQEFLFEGPLSSKPGKIPMGGYNSGGGEKF